MHILLDHISASLVAGILFIAVFTMMHRNRQNTFEMSVNQVVNERAYDFLKVIERDIENMRSTSELTSESAPIDTLCLLVDSTLQITNPDGTVTPKNRTLRFTFPTFEETIADTTISFLPPPEYVSITYEMVDTGLKTMVNGESKPLYRVDRLRQAVDGGPVNFAGSSGEIITNFSVRMFGPGGPEECADNGNLRRTVVEFEAASWITYDSDNAADRNIKSRSNLNATRYGATIYSPNR